MTNLQTIYQIIQRIGTRKILLILFVFVSIFVYFKERKRKRKHLLTDEELEEIYERDENGLFPWEVNTNDSPKEIPKEATRYYYDQGRPKRGRW